jgi:hypothetical protein
LFVDVGVLVGGVKLGRNLGLYQKKQTPVQKNQYNASMRNQA